MSTTHTPAPDAAPDPVSFALAELVDAGHLTTDQARAAYAAGRAVPAANRRWDLLAVAIGSAVVAVVVLLLGGEIRDGDDLEWLNFLLALGGSTSLLAFALAARRLVADPERRADLMSWPIALGSVAMGFLGGELMGDNDAAPYVAGLAVVLLAGGGYWLCRRLAPLVAVILGLALIHFSALFALVEELDGRHAAVWMSGGVTLFVLLVTLAGWALPTRNLTAILAGVVGVVGQLAGIWTIVALGFFGGVMSTGFDADMPVDSESYSDEWEEFDPEDSLCMPGEGMTLEECEELDDTEWAEDYCLDSAEEQGMTQEECVKYETCYEDDATCLGMTDEECLADDFCETDAEMDADFSDEEWMDDESYGEDEILADMGFSKADQWGVLGFGALLLLLWAACHRLTGHVGFRVLTLAALGAIVPFAFTLIVGDNSVAWAAVPGTVGLLVLAFVAFRAVRAERPQQPKQTETVGGPPVA